MSQKEPKPEIYRLEELAILVKSGDIKLPRFQRPFVWRRSDMLKLLDSIYKGYPIGSLLLWNSSQRLKSERDIAGLKVGEESTLYPTSYLLDGQQRLTTICGALYWDGTKLNDIWNIHFDLETEEFVHPKNVDNISLFPLNKLLQTSQFIKQCMKFAHHANHSIYTERAEKLLRTIKDYKIAVVKIGDMSIEQVAPIFERINSTGRKLTIVDLMMAATWSNGFDLSAEIHKIQSNCLDLGFSGLSEQLILRSISSSSDFGINKEDIQKLRTLSSEQLRSSASKCSNAVELAAKWLIQQMSITDTNYLPYNLFFTYLVEFFRCNPSPSPEALKEFESWFWFTSSTQYFGGSSTGDISRDLLNVREFANGKRLQLFNRTQINIGNLINDKFNLKNASSMAFALLLLSVRPSLSLSGKELDYDVLLDKNSKFFGKLSLNKNKNQDSNIFMVIDPSRNLIESLSKDSGVIEHFLNDKCVEHFNQMDEEAFINERSDIVMAAISDLTGCSAFVTTPEFNLDDDESLEGDDS
ncbi:TPA: DUF262 domain-containing protein [Klebsiella variicola]|uniref:DUF262 domain-containing protein n=1 Tax=Klebsiella variicola TaxID=244366 RepID=UPI001C8100F4|nr:DUF262 domain-containing protein [Klebsiella variicola]CAF9746284.1 hypothetical protein AI3070V1_5027 [Klebsiella pneumoniae]HDS4072724.1 DUF262 domain-containing protein [Klebsiella pneumoniae subsp. pneumoniae]MBX4611111.1 hypothetical protein [Klebsiella variicola]CAH6266671.1 hypothetical protein AI3070V1_5027 [Klebsiella pneumoniae]HBX9993968.1 DUF262 domain-containing protein [Klebsiella variicola]